MQGASVRREHVLLHRRERGDRLPRRARRIRDVDRAVQAPGWSLLGGGVGSAAARACASCGSRKTDGSKVGYDASASIEPSRGSIATTAPPSAAQPLFSCASVIPSRSACSAARWRLEVEREPERVARALDLLLDLRRAAAARASRRVSWSSRPRRAGTCRRPPRPPPGRSGRRAVAVLLQRLQLAGVDLADVSRGSGRRERAVRVVAEIAALELHARELRLVLLDVGDLVVVDSAPDHGPA